MSGCPNWDDEERMCHTGGLAPSAAAAAGDLCWNCDAAPGDPAEERFEIDGVTRTTWSCPKCSDRWTNGIDEQDREIAAVKRKAAALQAAAARIEEPLRMMLHAAQGPLADLVRRCHRDLPHNHESLRIIRDCMQDLTERHADLAVALRAAEER
jgi:PHP family Zn ribbon phosphoesterase